MAEKLYEVILNELKEELKFSKIDTQFYSERVLAKNKNISKLTARKILNILENEGYLYKKPNSGSYVKRNVQFSLVSFSLFDSDIKFKLVYLKTDYTNIKHMPIDTDYKISRYIFLTYKDDEIQSLEEIYLSEKREDFVKYFSDINKNKDDFSIFKNIKIIQSFNSKIIPLKFFKILNVNVNEPVVVIKNEFFDLDNQKIMLINSYLNPKNNKFKIY